MKRFKKSTMVPLLLLVYLAAMSIIGLSYFNAGNYGYYFGVIGGTLIVIIILHFLLKKREKLQDERKNKENNQ